MAFDRRRNKHCLADRFEIARSTVRRLIMVVSHSLLELQLKQLESLADFAEQRRPDFSSVCLMWDETGQRLSLNAIKGGKHHQQSSTWQTLVARCHITVGFRDGIKLYHELVMPPVPLAANSAGHIERGLFAHPLTQPMMAFTLRILRASSRRCFIHEMDGHLANEKLVLWRQLQEVERRRSGGDAAEPPILMDAILCQNHQANLTVTLAADQAAASPEAGGGKLIPNLYCCTLFLRMGGHFVRLLASVQILVKQPDFFEWIPSGGACSEQVRSGMLFGAELAAYLVDNLKFHEKIMALNFQAQTTRKADEIRNCFIKVLNGPYWNRDKLIHRCTYDGCCSSLQEAQQKTAAAVMHVVCRYVPCLPMLSDWTKLGPCLDFYMAAQHQNVLGKLLDRAAWAMKFPQHAELREDEEVDWHGLAGRRFQRARSCLSCALALATWLSQHHFGTL